MVYSKSWCHESDQVKNLNRRENKQGGSNEEHEEKGTEQDHTHQSPNHGLIVSITPTLTHATESSSVKVLRWSGLVRYVVLMWWIVLQCRSGCPVVRPCRGSCAPGRSGPRRGTRCRPFQCDREEIGKLLSLLSINGARTTHQGGSPKKKKVLHDMPDLHRVKITTRSEIACALDVGHATRWFSLRSRHELVFSQRGGRTPRNACVAPLCGMTVYVCCV